MLPSSWASLSPPTLSHSSRVSQTADLRSLNHTPIVLIETLHPLQNSDIYGNCLCHMCKVLTAVWCLFWWFIPTKLSVQFSHSVVSYSLWPHGEQHNRLPCPSPTPRACSNSCPLSRWCHPNISSSVIPFSPSLLSFPASGSFPMSQFFASGGQSIGVSAQHQSFQWIFRIDFLRINWFDLFPVQGTLKSLLQHLSSKASILQHSAFFMVQLSHPYMTTRKTIALTRWSFVSKVMSLLFNITV